MKKVIFIFIIFTKLIFGWKLVLMQVDNYKFKGKTSAITYTNNAYLRADKLPEKSNFILYMGDYFDYDKNDKVDLKITYGDNKTMDLIGNVWPFREFLLSIHSGFSEELDKLLLKEDKITIEAKSKTGKTLKATFDTSGYKEIKKKMKIGGDYD